MNEIKYVITGDPRTKKNHLMIAGSGRRCPVCKKPEKQWVRQGKAHDEWKERALWQLRPRPTHPIDCEVNIKCLFYMETRRRVDSLNLLAAIDDLLVEAGVIGDDNCKIVVSHNSSRVLYDKDDPRTEIIISRVESDQLSLLDGVPVMDR